MQPVVRRAFSVLAALLLLAAPALAQLAAQEVVSGIPNIVAFVQDPAIPNTFYLVQQSGTVRVLQDGDVLDTPFLDLTGEVSTAEERGLLGMAFAPNVGTGWVFVNYTNASGATVIARFARSAGNPIQADVGSRLDLRWPSGQQFIPQPAANHNGGHLAFGPDGFLYIGLGDGGGGNDQFNTAQNPDTLLGKMLRIDVNVPPGDEKGYRVPPSNPFVPFIPLGEIWDIGLRNPWRYSFDNVALGGTGALVIGDVGQGAREEVNYEPAGQGGRDYGWPIFEGTIATPGVNAPPPPLPLTAPLFDYPRSIGRAVTGGYVYRGSLLPASFRGRYFVGDWGSGIIASVGLALNPATGEASMTDAVDHTAELAGNAVVQVSTFAEDASGELYFVSYGAPGAVYKIVPDLAALPGAPEGFTSQVNGSSVLLSWSPPAGGAPPQYQLEVGSSPGASNLLVTTISGSLTSIGSAGVADGLYYARLRGANAAGAGPPSPELPVFVGCSGAPSAPSTLSHIIAGPVVTLQWGAVPDVASYVLEVGSASGLADLLAVPVAPGITSLSGAVPGGSYYARVHAQNACGASPASNEVTVLVP